jgi:hypothetical protein
VIVPQYWAEGRAQHRERGRQVTVRRFGWSDASEAEAQAHADSRANEALQRALDDDDLPRREPKLPYNGAEGVPIREEIVSRHDDAIVTRTTYGARCLNTPDVLFADIDFPEGPDWRLGAGIAAAAMALIIGVGVWSGSGWVAFGLTLAAIFGVAPLTRAIGKAMRDLKGGVEAMSIKRVREFIATHSEWNLRVYRTPAGLRLLATHRKFDPTDASVQAFFQAVGADRVYVRMCMNQHCFRARVSPKPWRIGIGTHMRPRPGVWPVRAEKLAIRNEWIEAYEAKATGFAACRFMEVIGSGNVHLDVGPTIALHDELSGALSERPIA